MSKLHRLTQRRVAKVVAVSQSVASVVREQGIFRPDQINVVHNGIDLTKFHLRAPNHFAGRLRVGMLGELTPNKGQLEFARASQTVAERIANVDFIIAGRDNSRDGDYGLQLKALIKASKFRDRIQLIESSIDVPEFLAGLDIVVSASRSEAFGLVIVEAMAAGVPVVATATAGACEIISDNETGRLVPVDDVNEMAAAILLLLNDSAQRQRITESARENVTRNFSLERMVSDTEAIYRQVLSS
jgi:glycosyltransferase involved in cell wall biosynthesis